MGEKAAPNRRSYFADAEGWLADLLAGPLAAAAAATAVSGTVGLGEEVCDTACDHVAQGGRVMPLVRFLEYPEPGGGLPPHVDLSRIDAATGQRSSVSFLLYLTDCFIGGETLLLDSLPGDEALAPQGGVAPGARNTLAAVAPRRGRLLLM